MIKPLAAASLFTALAIAFAAAAAQAIYDDDGVRRNMISCNTDGTYTCGNTCSTPLQYCCK